MAIPDFQTLMLPLLELLKDGKPVKLSEMVEIMSDKYNLTEEERNEWLPSKVQKTMYNRVAWAKQYLKNSEYKECANILENKIINFVVNLIKEREPEYEYTTLMDLIEYSELILDKYYKYLAEKIKFYEEEEDLNRLERLLALCKTYNIE